MNSFSLQEFCQKCGVLIWKMLCLFCRKFMDVFSYKDSKDNKLKLPGMW
jgi:hypothetical protein